MSNVQQKDQVFGDYAAFLHALLPHAQGFLFHDRHGHLFWHDKAPDTSLLDDEYHATLNRILQFGELPGESARIPLRDCVAYLVRLVSDKGRPLGVLTALVDREVGGMPHKFCSDLLRPALRSLERELSLRVHLLDATRLLSDHDSESEFLRLLGDCSRSTTDYETALRETLQLALQKLSLAGAVFYSPDHELQLVVGEEPASPEEAALLYEAFCDELDLAEGDVGRVLNDRPAPDPQDRTLSWPVFETGNRLAGVLVLSLPGGRKGAGARTASLATFVVSTLEHLLEKAFDPVTGLVHWAGFERALQEACAAKAGSCILYIDVDQLHVVNEILGHDAGDSALRDLAVAMRKALQGNLLTRVTSDSFAALLHDVDLERARQLAQNACDRVRQLEYSKGEETFRPSVSIGVAALEPESGPVGNALAPAQIACQAAKDRGRGRVEVYESSDQSIVRRMDDLNLVGSIRSAIEGGRLVLFAQPIVSLIDDDSGAYHELLVRMLNTAGNPVPPSEFMGAAERYQLMQELDRWVVSKAIETLTDEQTDEHGRSRRFAVNLSGQSIGSEEFLAFVKREFSRTGLSPDRICFEVTETVAVGNLVRAQNFMNELRELGCQFSLDDFGTGMSSFAYLKMFPIQKIKIDGSFVRDICENEVSRSMVAAMSDIARVMNIETVAEYVVDEHVLEAVKALGITWAQGFHVGEPVRMRELFRGSTIIDKADLADVDPSLIARLPA